MFTVASRRDTSTARLRGVSRMIDLADLKRRAKMARLKIELKWHGLSLWYKRKKLQYHQWRLQRLESRERYLESRRYQEGSDDE